MDYDWGGHGAIKFQSQKNIIINFEKNKYQNYDQNLITISLWSRIYIYILQLSRCWTTTRVPMNLFLI
jgi:hypothetical protein